MGHPARKLKIATRVRSAANGAIWAEIPSKRMILGHPARRLKIATRARSAASEVIWAENPSKRLFWGVLGHRSRVSRKPKVLTTHSKFPSTRNDSRITPKGPMGPWAPWPLGAEGALGPLALPPQGPIRGAEGAMGPLALGPFGDAQRRFGEARLYTDIIELGHAAASA